MNRTRKRTPCWPRAQLWHISPPPEHEGHCLSSCIVNWTYITGGRALRVLLMCLRYLITKEKSLKDHIAHRVTSGFNYLFFFSVSFGSLSFSSRYWIFQRNCLKEEKRSNNRQLCVLKKKREKKSLANGYFRGITIIPNAFCPTFPVLLRHVWASSLVIGGREESHPPEIKHASLFLHPRPAVMYSNSRVMTAVSL